MSFVVTGCTTRCHWLYHSLSLVVPFAVIRSHSLYHYSLSLAVPFVAICCRSLYHSFSLDVSLVCLFINDPSMRLNSQEEKRLWYGWISPLDFRGALVHCRETVWNFYPLDSPCCWISVTYFPWWQLTFNFAFVL